MKTYRLNININVHPITVLAFLLLSSFAIKAQDCPPNIDFESGSFNGWQCYVGNTQAVGGQNVINLSPSAPQFDRHTIIPAIPGEVDPYGGFLTRSPNGSRYCVRLGNNKGGGQAEGMSYEFTIPADRNVYSLIYYYAVVFQDPNHEIYQQPRMVVDITNETDNQTIGCSSFYFVPYGTILPGFFESPNPGGSTPVWCKNWSAVTVNLNGLAGKKIKLFFKTADCTFQHHFGYAYIDVNSECSDEFTGALFCRDDTTVNVIAPYGYQAYTWYNSSFTQVLGNQQTLTFSPLPPSGTTVAVEIVPYSGYGCLDTLYAHLIDTLHVKADAGPDTFTCNNNPVPIGKPPKQGFIYSWTPTTGLSDPNVSNPFANPSSTTTYVLSIRHDGGGCMDIDSVVVRTPMLDDSLQLLGKTSYCLDNNDSAVLKVFPADSIQWYRNGTAIRGANGTRLNVRQSGTYYAMLFSREGCSVKTSEQPIEVETARKGIRYPFVWAVPDLPQGLQARQFGDSVYWSPGVYLDARNTYTSNYRGSTQQEYTVEIITAAGCITVDTQLVKIGKKMDIYVPSGFTPNGDGKNDVLRPTLMGIKELKSFKVFNRWGELIFETQKEYEGWDGKVKGLLPQQTDVFVWTAEAIGADGTTITRKGTSVLIR